MQALRRLSKLRLLSSSSHLPFPLPDIQPTTHPKQFSTYIKQRKHFTASQLRKQYFKKEFARLSSSFEGKSPISLLRQVGGDPQTPASEIERLLSKFKRENVELDTESYCYAMQLFSKRRKFHLVRQLFEEMRSLHLPLTEEAYALLFRAMSLLNPVPLDQLDHLYREFQSLQLTPSPRLFDAWLHSYSRHCDLAGMWAVERERERTGTARVEESFFVLLVGCLRANDSEAFWSTVRELFLSHLRVSPRQWRLMFRHAASLGDVEALESLHSEWVERSQEERQSRGLSAFEAEAEGLVLSSLAKAYALLGDGASAEKVLAESRTTSPEAVAAIIRLYGSTNRLRDAQRVFDRVTEELGANLMCYNAMVEALSIANRSQEAMQLLGEMLSQDITPTTGTCSLMIEGLAKNNDTAGIQKVIAFAEQVGIELDVNIFNHAMNSQAKSGNIVGVLDVLKQMRRHRASSNTSTANILINAFKRVRDFPNCWKVYRELRDPPNLLTFQLLSEVCGWEGNTKRLPSLWDEFGKWRLVPTEVELNVAMTACARDHNGTVAAQLLRRAADRNLPWTVRLARSFLHSLGVETSSASSTPFVSLPEPLLKVAKELQQDIAEMPDDQVLSPFHAKQMQSLFP